MDAKKMHERANAAAHAEAEAFFKANPSRTFHVQKSRPYEFADWGLDDHLKSKRTIVFWDRSSGRSIVRRKAVSSEGPIPDTDEFLFELWAPFFLTDQSTLEIDPITHFGLLVLHGGRAA